MNKEKERGLEASWNRFARLLLKVEKAWNAHRECMLSASSADIEKYPIETQRWLSQGFNKAEFSTMMPQLIKYCRVSGGIEIIKPRRKV